MHARGHLGARIALAPRWLAMVLPCRGALLGVRSRNQPYDDSLAEKIAPVCGARQHSRNASCVPRPRLAPTQEVPALRTGSEGTRGSHRLGKCPRFAPTQEVIHIAVAKSFVEMSLPLQITATLSVKSAKLGAPGHRQRVVHQEAGKKNDMDAELVLARGCCANAIANDRTGDATPVWRDRIGAAA